MKVKIQGVRIPFNSDELSSSKFIYSATALFAQRGQVFLLVIST